MCTAASMHACPFHDACLVCMLHACYIIIHHFICIHCGLCSKALPIHCEEVSVTILLCSSACIRCLHSRLSRCQHRCCLLHAANAYCCFAGCFLALFLFYKYLLVSSPTFLQTHQSRYNSLIANMGLHHFWTVWVANTLVSIQSLITNMGLHYFWTAWITCCSKACCDYICYGSQVVMKCC